jgi:hypothetical protein
MATPASSASPTSAGFRGGEATLRRVFFRCDGSRDQLPLTTLTAVVQSVAMASWAMVIGTVPRRLS